MLLSAIGGLIYICTPYIVIPALQSGPLRLPGKGMEGIKHRTRRKQYCLTDGAYIDAMGLDKVIYICCLFKLLLDVIAQHRPAALIPPMVMFLYFVPHLLGGLLLSIYISIASS